MSEFRDSGKEIARLRDRMNRLLSDSSREMKHPESLNEVEWVPPLDILEDKDDVIVKVDIPGMKPDEIDLSISGDVLHIRGERKREMEREDENYHTIERGYGKFNRQIPLPTSVNTDGIKASYKDGVLIVRLPKLEKSKVGEIKVELE